ncbi:MAG: Rne/Rng family ribonuclease, partial [Firmicutes bacterium]|nr:Rne/Rng family ribonuclease [Bacillota bacterium]
MEKEIIIRAEADETMVAVMEDRRLVELYIDRADEERLTGNIYKGIVENVLPGMQAAFVDIGLNKNSFLYIREVLPKMTSEDEPIGDVGINDLLKKGQEILIQIVKEPTPTKGARVTTHLTLAGRYLVLMPTVSYIGISRRIEDEEERKRLGSIAENICPEGMGVIVRTVAQGAGVEELQSDLKWLKSVWSKIINKSAHSKGSRLIYKDLNLLSSILRDQVTEDVTRIIVNNKETYDTVVDGLQFFNGDYKNRVIIDNMMRVFEDYNLFEEIKKAGKRKAWLKNGGYIVIDSTEALTAIDVNTGKYVGTTNLEDTVVNANIEAVEEIVRQVRLRNIGGIIIIDFIDMEKEEDRNKVIEALEKELKKDRVKTNILGLTQLGLLEMTLKKTGHGLNQMMDRECRCCDGRGRVYNDSVQCLEIRHQVEKEACSTQAEKIRVEAPSALIQYIKHNKLQTKWAQECGKEIVL